MIINTNSIEFRKEMSNKYPQILNNGEWDRFSLTLLEWEELITKAEKSLADSITCHEKFGEHEDWIKEDTLKLEKLRKSYEEVKTQIKDVREKGVYNLVKSLSKNK